MQRKRGIIIEATYFLCMVAAVVFLLGRGLGWF
jgi:hypothetical protein